MEEQSITHIWTRFNRQWLLCGVIAGLLAGLAIIIVAMPFSEKFLGEPLHFLKIIGAMFTGIKGMNYGPLGPSGFAGLGVHLLLSSIYGFVYAQLVDERSQARSLIVIALVTCAIIWVFSYCLFMPAFNFYFLNMVTIKTGLLMHLLFGLSFGLILSMVRKILLKNDERPAPSTT